MKLEIQSDKQTYTHAHGQPAKQTDRPTDSRSDTQSNGKIRVLLNKIKL